MSQLDQQVRQRVEEFVEEITQLVKQEALESVAEALRAAGLSGAPSRGGRVAQRRGGGGVSGRGRGKGQKRTPEELEALTGNLLKEIKKQPGRRIEEIAESMETTTKELALPAKKLLEDKKIKTRGQKRATKYYPK